MVGEVLAMYSLSETEKVVRRGGSWNGTEDLVMQGHGDVCGQQNKSCSMKF